MTLFKRHMGRRVAAVGVAVALLVLGLDARLRGVRTGITLRDADSAASTGLRGHDHRNELPDSHGVPSTLSPSAAPTGRANVHRFGHPARGHRSRLAARRLAANRRRDQRRRSHSQRSRTSRRGAPPVRASRPSRPRAASWAPRSRSPERLHDGTDRGAFQHLHASSPRRTQARPSLTAVVPAGATTGPIHVYTAAGQRHQRDQLHRDPGAGSHDHLVHARPSDRSGRRSRSRGRTSAGRSAGRASPRPR